MLKRSALSALEARGIKVPAYRHTTAPGVLHLGLGAFHRAHQALIFDDLLARGDMRWSVLGVAMHNPALAMALEAQEGLYALQIVDAHHQHWRICGSIAQTCVAAQSRSGVVEALAAASTRFVTLTVTEKGYAPALATLLVEGLSLRRSRGQGGLTIASCDNISANGDKLQGLCLQAAQDMPLARWIATRCTFPNSMVDRIVPAAASTTLDVAADALGMQDRAALRTEAFWEWVIERRFVDPSDADALQSVGVQVVEDVQPFELAKLRMLNGSHSALACIGAVAGLGTVSDCIARAELRGYVHALMTREVGPLLQRPLWKDYRDALLARFANASLQHSVHQIASDSSQKIPQRWVPSALAAIRQGTGVECLAFAAAAWMRYCTGIDERGVPYAISDPLADTLRALALASRDDVPRTFDALGTLEGLWGSQLPTLPHWRSRVEAHLLAIRTQGMLTAVGRVAMH